MQVGRGARGFAPVSGCCAFRVMAAAALAMSVTGCSSSLDMPRSSDTRATSIAFESIDGLPADLARRYERDLKDAAAARQITVVPRAGEPSYRVRVYLSSKAAHGATSVTWAFDVYGADRSRAFRVNGEDSVPAVGTRVWTAGSDPVLRRIARSGMTQLAAYLSAPPGAEPEPSRPRGGLLAGIEDINLGGSGIFQLFRGEPMPPEPVGEAAAQ